MSVMVTPTAVNAVTRSTLVTISCDVCGNQLNVTTSDCRVEMMLARLAVAHEARCGERVDKLPACGFVRDGWECIADRHDSDPSRHYFVRLDG